MATLTTPKLALPYPDGAERVMDGDNAIGALALAIDPHLAQQVNPTSCVVTGAALVGLAGAELKLPVDSLVSGRADMMDAAGDRVIIPAGGAGLYLIIASCSHVNTVGPVRFRLQLSGVATFDGATVSQQGASSTAVGSMSAVYPLAAGATVEVLAIGNSGDPGDVQLRRLVVMRIGDAFGTA